jgi:GT2 family glycosyltransferase
VVSVIIINYNTFELTCNCIESVVAHTTIPYEIILVDNASTECDPNLFKKKYPSIRLILNTTNVGFAAGNNSGIMEASGDTILLLNSDTYLLEDSIGKTLEFFDEYPEAGVVGCRMIYQDGTLQHAARRFRSFRWELLDLFRPVLYFLPYKKRAFLMLGKYFKSDFITECDWLNGAFFMFKKDLLHAFPKHRLDERFFMYGEDQLWCWQIKNLGKKNIFFPKTSIVHINNASTSYKKRLKLRETMLKHELEILKLRLGSGFNYFLTSLLYKCKEKFRMLIKKLVWSLTGKLIR